jgi:hypothetical protein
MYLYCACLHMRLAGNDVLCMCTVLQEVTRGNVRGSRDVML